MVMSVWKVKMGEGLETSGGQDKRGDVPVDAT